MLRIDVFAACPQGTNQAKTNLVNSLYKQRDKNFQKLFNIIGEVIPNAVSSIVLVALDVVFSQVDGSNSQFPKDLEMQVF
jgi:hypothetical protein